MIQNLISVSLLTSAPRPEAIVCTGLNYHDHVEEQDEGIPEKPMLFTKSPVSVAIPGSLIVHPSDVSQVDYEIELSIIIDRTTSGVLAADVADYLTGYTILNDVSAQFENGQFSYEKSYDTFAPMDPTIVTGNDFDPNALDVSFRVNGDVTQESNTDEFIFDADDLVSYVNGLTTLRSGDVISTEISGGIGVSRNPPGLLEPGDTVGAEI